MGNRDGAPYPVQVHAPAVPTVSRWLWLVKWLLLVPHLLVLTFLWLGFAVLSVVAFVAIVISGRYPRALFEFNAGVLRWSWRVHFYGYAALGTDEYPPFTLADVPSYPARLQIAYPRQLSRGLALVKWWLLALPHFVVLTVFIGGGLWLVPWRHTASVFWNINWGVGGLVGLLVFIAAVALLFTGRYPRALYDFVLGMDRWALRVAAYAGLMTDVYPPFRLDMGGTEPGEVLTPSAATSPSAPPTVTAPSAVDGAPSLQGPGTTAWSGGRILAVVVGAVLMFISTGALVLQG